MLRALLTMAVLWGFIASSAAAQNAPSDSPRSGPALNWTRQPGAESCIASVELAGRIEARVKKKIFVPAPEAIVAIEGYVAPSPSGGFRASIAMSDGQGLLYGSRELETQGACGELNDGLVFVIAVTLRPEAGGVTGIELPENVANALDALFGAEPTEPSPAAFPTTAQPAYAPPPPSPPPAPVAAAERESDREPKAPQTLRAFIEALGAVQLGLQPEIGLGGGGGIRIQITGAGSLSLHGALFAPSRKDISDASDDNARSYADFRARMLSLGYCTPAWLGGSVLGLEACAAGRIGDVIANAQNFDGGNYEVRSVFVSLGLAARLTVELNANVIVALALGPELHLARPVFEYATSEGPATEAHNPTLYKTDTFGGAADLSVAFALF